MNGINRIKTNECFDFINRPIGFERAHCMNFTAAHEPIQRGHWSAVFEKWCI
jgi:hypothetical protein